MGWQRAWPSNACPRPFPPQGEEQLTLGSRANFRRGARSSSCRVMLPFSSTSVPVEASYLPRQMRHTGSWINQLQLGSWSHWTCSSSNLPFTYLASEAKRPRPILGTQKPPCTSNRNCLDQNNARNITYKNNKIDQNRLELSHAMHGPQVNYLIPEITCGVGQL